MSCCTASAGFLSALFIKFPKCADAGSTQQHPGSSFPALPCQVVDHIPAATRAKRWSLSPVAQTTRGSGMWSQSMGCATFSSTHSHSIPSHSHPSVSGG